jgi:nitroreductase
VSTLDRAALSTLLWHAAAVNLVRGSLLADLGHAIENLRAAAHALGVPLELLQAFDEARMAAALGLDEREEGVLACLALGAAAPASGPASAGPRWHVPSLDAGGRLGVTEAIHRATSLRGPGARAPAPASPGSAAAPGGESFALPVPRRHGVDVLAAIARRRSVRRYSAAALEPDQLAALLDSAARRIAPALSGALRVHVVTHAVHGMPAAAWRYRAEAPALHRTGAAEAPREARSRSRRAALDQDVAADAAALLVLSIDRAAFAADAGGAARGCRHALIEAGLAGERIHLEAVALGLGAAASMPPDLRQALASSQGLARSSLSPANRSPAR